jgi:hypothetical protein
MCVAGGVEALSMRGRPRTCVTRMSCVDMEVAEAATERESLSAGRDSTPSRVKLLQYK